MIYPMDDFELKARNEQSNASNNDVDGGNNDGDANQSVVAQILRTVQEEARKLGSLGLSPVKGLLLYGPPGCGKSLLAREMATVVKAREPKVVSATDLLDRSTDGSEALVRTLFEDAENELAGCDWDVNRSALHIIVIDEIDAVFRTRSGSTDRFEATRASAVNHILAKLDGVNSIPNVLLIGTTNRPELLDKALLRPGRLEVQIEIPMPNAAARREILDIHFAGLRRSGKISKALCCALDGVRSYDQTRDPLAKDESDVLGKSFSRVRKVAGGLLPSLIKTKFDLAADYATGGMSGADIAGIVRCAGSLALDRARYAGTGVDSLVVTLKDVKDALEETRKCKGL